MDKLAILLTRGNASAAERLKPQDTVFASSRWSDKYRGAEQRSRYSRLSNSLVLTLEQRLSDFSSTLDRFRWPRTNLPRRNSRLPESAAIDSGAIAARLHYGSDVKRFYKFFSKGFDADRGHDLDQGEQTLTLTQNGTTRTISIEVDEDDTTWQDVLEKVRDGVNESLLPVQAELITQRYAEQKVDGLAATGTILALAVDRAVAAQDLSVDTRSVLARTLDLEKTLTPATGPALARYSLQGLSPARPSTFISDILDPEDDSNVLSGEYDLTYTLDGQSGTVTVFVPEDASWREVLSRTSKAINSSQFLFSGTVGKADRFVVVNDERLTADGVDLRITVQGAKLGERLSLADGQARAADTALAFHDPTSSLPTARTGDTYIATATGNGWTEDNIYTFNGSTWDETIPSSGTIYYVSGNDDNYQFDGANWSLTSLDGLLATLGVEGTAVPGSDAALVVDGQSEISATGTFSLDQGRLSIDLLDLFGETVPLRVVQAMETIQNSLLDVLQEYNGWRRFLLVNQDILANGLAAAWRDPLEDRREGLTWLGIEEVGKEDLLVVDGERFWSALFQDPARAESLLAVADEGLIPDWQRMVREMLERGPDRLLIPETALAESDTRVRSEFELEKQSRLLDLIG